MPVDLMSGFASVAASIMAHKRLLRLVKILAGVSTGAEAEFSRLERFAHFWVLAGRSFVRNRCPVRAAALSYTSLLALIPLLALAISITSSLLKSQGEEKIYGAIDKFVSDIMPPAGSNTNTVSVSLNLSSPVPLVKIPTNSEAVETPSRSFAETNQAAATDNNDRVANAQKEAARSI